MSRVYIVMDDGRKDLSPCLKYGDPIILFKESFYPNSVEERAPRALKHALRSLEKFDERNDFLLLVGDLALTAVCVAAMVMLGKMNVKFLKYDRRSREYYSIPINFDGTLGVI